MCRRGSRTATTLPLPRASDLLPLQHGELATAALLSIFRGLNLVPLIRFTLRPSLRLPVLTHLLGVNLPQRQGGPGEHERNSAYCSWPPAPNQHRQAGQQKSQAANPAKNQRAHNFVTIAIQVGNLQGAGFFPRSCTPKERARAQSFTSRTFIATVSRLREIGSRPPHPASVRAGGGRHRAIVRDLDGLRRKPGAT